MSNRLGSFASLDDDKREYVNERAAIREFDGGQRREDAEKAAYAEMIHIFHPEQKYRYPLRD